MKYEEKDGLIIIDPETLSDRMKLESFLDGFDQLKPGFMDDLGDGDIEATREAIDDALTYLRDAFRSLSDVEDELDSIK